MHPLSAIREVLVSARDGIDGALHRRRLDKAIRRLEALQPDSVLFICLGNVCRSPYAERVLRASVPAGLDIDSGGFIGPGRNPPDKALEAATARGIDHADHLSRVALPEELGSADAVFIFDRFNAKDVRKAGSTPPNRVFWLGDLDPEWTGKRAIIDPWGRSLEDFERTFVRIERCLETVVNALPDRARPGSTDGTPAETA